MHGPTCIFWANLTPFSRQLKAAELYDHQEDIAAWQADKFENVNLAATADTRVVKALSAQLHEAFGFPDAE